MTSKPHLRVVLVIPWQTMSQLGLPDPWDAHLPPPSLSWPALHLPADGIPSCTGLAPLYSRPCLPPVTVTFWCPLASVGRAALGAGVCCLTSS